MKNKGVFFVKKEKRPIPEGNIDIAEYLAIGDVYPNVLGMLRTVMNVVTSSVQITCVPGWRKSWSQYSITRKI